MRSSKGKAFAGTSQVCVTNGCGTLDAVAGLEDEVVLPLEREVPVMLPGREGFVTVTMLGVRVDCS